MLHPMSWLSSLRVVAGIVVVTVLMCQPAARGSQADLGAQSDGVDSYTEIPRDVPEPDTTETVTGQFYYKVRRRVIVETRKHWTEYREEEQEVLRYKPNEETGENEVVKTTIIVKVPTPQHAIVKETKYITETRCVTLDLKADFIAKEGTDFRSEISGGLSDGSPKAEEEAQEPAQPESQTAAPPTESPGLDRKERRLTLYALKKSLGSLTQDQPTGSEPLIPATCRPKLGPAAGTIQPISDPTIRLTEVAPLVPVAPATCQPLPRCAFQGWVASEGP